MYGRRDEREGGDCEREWGIQNDRFGVNSLQPFSTLLSSILPLLGTAGCCLIPHSVLLLFQTPPSYTHIHKHSPFHALPQFPPPGLLSPPPFSFMPPPPPHLQFSSRGCELNEGEISWISFWVYRLSLLLLQKHAKTSFKSFRCCLALFPLWLFPSSLPWHNMNLFQCQDPNMYTGQREYTLHAKRFNPFKWPSKGWYPRKERWRPCQKSSGKRKEKKGTRLFCIVWVKNVFAKAHKSPQLRTPDTTKMAFACPECII